MELDAVAEVVDLYDWRGGTLAAPGTPLDDIHFFPGFYLLELEDAIRDYVGFRDDPRWRPDWLPVFANGGGDFYVADLASARSGAAPMIGFMVGGPEHLVEYESLRGMIATIAECYEKGAYFVDDRGYLEVDDQLHATIARRHNPSVELWSGAS